MTLKQAIETQWKNDPAMVNHCLKNTVYLEMDGYFLSVANKPIIDSTIYYADQDYNTGEMAKDPGNSKEVFKRYNIRLNSPIRNIEYMDKCEDVVISPNYYNDRTGLLKSWSTKRSYEPLAEGSRLATEQEKKMIYEALQEEGKKYEARLETYYKRYGNKIRTNSYWADR